MSKTKEIIKVINTLKNNFPDKGAVELGKAEDVLLATVLSARTRDEQVLKVYPKLRQSFPKLADLAAAKTSDIEKSINEIGLYRAKARSLKGIAKLLLKDHKGKVPDTMEELIALPGVGRKTANCVLCYAFKVPAIAVDIHVHRITNRLGWIKTDTPMATEFALNNLVPKDLWLDVNRVFVQFGRNACLPRKPRCYECPVIKYCGYKHKTRSK